MQTTDIVDNAETSTFPMWQIIVHQILIVLIYTCGSLLGYRSNTSSCHCQRRKPSSTFSMALKPEGGKKYYLNLDIIASIGLFVWICSKPFSTWHFPLYSLTLIVLMFVAGVLLGEALPEFFNRLSSLQEKEMMTYAIATAFAMITAALSTIYLTNCLVIIGCVGIVTFVCCVNTHTRQESHGRRSQQRRSSSRNSI